MRILLALMLVWSQLAAAQESYAPVKPGATLLFPGAFGAHPAFRTEWWYITGWLKTDDHRDLGFQITFFRSKPSVDDSNPSHFTPRQIIFAHAALSDPKTGHLSHDQRIARQGFGLAEAALGNTDVRLDDWSLLREHDGSFITKIETDGFSFDFTLTPTQPPLLQGDNGFSRKGPLETDASYYFSLPHLTVSGLLDQAGHRQRVTGEAWLDREWSSSYLDPTAVGWDWLAVNLDDGGALTAFQIRDQRGQPIWAGGSWRDKEGSLTNLAPGDVAFATDRWWHSPRTGADYPVQRSLILKLGGKERHFSVTPLFDDQELDSRLGGGPVYWEGAATLGGDMTGRGYLELTGYLEKLTLN